MDERITALLAALCDDDRRADELATLSDEQVEATRDELRALFASIRAGEVENVDAEDLETLRSIRQAIEHLDTEREARVTAAAELAEEIASLEAGLDDGPEDDEPDDGDEGGETIATAEVVDVTDEGPQHDDGTPAEPEVVEVAAAAEPAPKPKRRQPSLASLAAHAPDASRPQPPAVTKPRWQSLDGKPITDELEIPERIIAALESFGDVPAGFPTQKISVVKLSTEQDEAHTLSDVEAGDPQLSMRKIEAITAAAKDPLGWSEEQRAIVASGGWCAPGESRYDIPSIASAARPFRDGLARMAVRRGSVNFVRAARLSTMLANTTAAAVTTWENSTDLSPGGSTKTRQTAACRTVQTEALGAVVGRMRFGNFAARAFPEDIAHDIELLAARHARVAEVRLLDALIGDMDIDVTQTGLTATARDLKHHTIQAVSELRYTERSKVQIRGALSSVLLDMILADVTLQAPGDDVLRWGESDARAVMAGVPNFSPIWVDDVPSGTEAFVTNSDGESLADFPDTFEIPFFYDGTAVFADGGSLDLGIIRDSTLVGTNDYEIFMETFEGLLWLGPYGKTLTLTTCPGGDSQAPVDNTGALCSGS